MNCYWCDNKLSLVFERDLKKNEPFSVRTILECNKCQISILYFKKKGMLTTKPKKEGFLYPLVFLV